MATYLMAMYLIYSGWRGLGIFMIVVTAFEDVGTCLVMIRIRERLRAIETRLNGVEGAIIMLLGRRMSARQVLSGDEEEIHSGQ